MTTADTLYWDPYDPALAQDPYPVYKRVREEAPLYYNEKYDFVGRDWCRRLAFTLPHETTVEDVEDSEVSRLVALTITSDRDRAWPDLLHVRAYPKPTH